MIETRRLKNVVILIQTILSFVPIKLVPMSLFTARQKNKEMTGQKETKNITKLPWFIISL